MTTSQQLLLQKRNIGSYKQELAKSDLITFRFEMNTSSVKLKEEIQFKGKDSNENPGTV